ncbi:molecular chaperone [Serratia sp. J2]|uniref:fimbrial biogenesis chaperone n=1 Tax=Serratia sp. J2 TaxID=3386551 RepID=UPI0039174F51
MLPQSIRAMRFWGLCFLVFVSWPSLANIIVSGTRVVYAGNEKEVTVKLSNTGNMPVLVQSWIDNGDIDAKPDLIQVPFILTPPINRINPNKSQTLRMSYTGTPVLPENKESVYWLNVLEIPALKETAAANRLQVAFRTRIKIFYRPAAIADRVAASLAAEKLAWSVEGGQLKATNSSPYFVSLVSITVKQGGRQSGIAGEMVPPQGSYLFKFKEQSLIRSGAVISYEYINDWGAVKMVDSPL